MLRRQLDRESRDAYALTLLAVDGGRPALWASLRMRVNVVDINDNGPAFTSHYETTLAENHPVGSSILQVHAEDPDVGANGQVTRDQAPRSVINPMSN